MFPPLSITATVLPAIRARSWRSAASGAATITGVPAVGLPKMTTFVSRSEAKRLLEGLAADFDTVDVDFTGVADVGQGVVDELLRVWPNAHPGKVVNPINMNQAVEFMVRRGLAR